MTEEDAAVTAAWLVPSPDRKLTAAERAAIDRGLAEADAGKLVPLEELEREFGLG